jgi:hypothetical protein
VPKEEVFFAFVSLQIGMLIKYPYSMDLSMKIHFKSEDMTNAVFGYDPTEFFLRQIMDYSGGNNMFRSGPSCVFAPLLIYLSKGG